MSEVKRYYSRVANSRYVFRDGHDCYFPAHFYDTDDVLEIQELDDLTKRDLNPLVFQQRDGTVPIFGANVPLQGHQFGRAGPAAVSLDDQFALSLAIAHAMQNKAQLTIDMIPSNLKAALTPDMVSRINTLMEMDSTAGALPSASGSTILVNGDSPHLVGPVNTPVSGDATDAALRALQEFNINPEDNPSGVLDTAANKTN